MMKLGMIFILYFIIILSKYDLAQTTTAQSPPVDIDERVCKGEPICNVTYKPTFEFKKCMCDSKCNLYDDCCEDSPYYNASALKINQQFICHEDFKFYLLKSCPTTFSNETVKFKCENISIGEMTDDPKSMKFVVDPQSNITYFNAYCAECNGISNLKPTRLSYVCNSGSPKYESFRDSDVEVGQILINAKYDAQTKSLVSVYNSTEYTCKHRVVIPQALYSNMRPCIPKLVSSCPVDYSERTVADKCQSYTSVVYTSLFIGGGTKYKNRYCAQCNGVTNDVHNCQTIAKRVGASSLFRAGSSGSSTCDESNILTAKFC